MTPNLAFTPDDADKMTPAFQRMERDDIMRERLPLGDLKRPPPAAAHA
jgi:hypothetical protein